MAVVAGAGKTLRRDRALLGTGARLERVEKREAHRLLQLGVAVEPHIGSIPELVEVGPLPGTSPSHPVWRASASAATTSSGVAGCERLLDHA